MQKLDHTTVLHVGSKELLVLSVVLLFLDLGSVLQAKRIIELISSAIFENKYSIPTVSFFYGTTHHVKGDCQIFEN